MRSVVDLSPTLSHALLPSLSPESCEPMAKKSAFVYFTSDLLDLNGCNVLIPFCNLDSERLDQVWLIRLIIVIAARAKHLKPISCWFASESGWFEWFQMINDHVKSCNSKNNCFHQLGSQVGNHHLVNRLDWIEPNMTKSITSGFRWLRLSLRAITIRNLRVL